MTNQYKPKSGISMMPYLVVDNAEASIDFYHEAFGFEVENTTRDADGKICHVEMRKDDLWIMFCPVGSMGTTTKTPKGNNIEEAVLLYCYTPDVDGLYEQALKHGAVSLMPPEDQYWGDRMCSVSDINGYRWSFARYLGRE